MNIQQLEQSLQDNLPPCFILKGDELFLIDKCKKLIIEKASKTDSLFDLSNFDDENYSIQSLINTLYQLPLIATKRVVVVRNLTNLVDQDKNKIKEYLENPNPDCVLILEDNLDKNLYKDIEAVVVECKRLFESQLIDYIKTQLKSYNKSISQENARLIVFLCASNLEIIKNEILKLSFCDTDEVDEKIILDFVPVNLDYEIYELTNALVEKNKDKSIKLLNDMIKRNTNVLGLISACFRRMFFSLISDATSLELAKIFKIKEYAVTKAKQQAQKFGAKKLMEISKLLISTEDMIKSGKMQAENALYYLVFNILC